MDTVNGAVSGKPGTPLRARNAASAPASTAREGGGGPVEAEVDNVEGSIVWCERGVAFAPAQIQREIGAGVLLRR